MKMGRILISTFVILMGLVFVNPHAAAKNKEVTKAELKKAEVVTFKIKGMTCAGCASGIKTFVEKVPDVLLCNVSFKKGEATVYVNPKSKTGKKQLAKKIKKAIRDAGFDTETIAWKKKKKAQ